MQRFYAHPTDTLTYANGAIGHRVGGPMDCLGPYAKVRNCPIAGTTLRLTCYAQGYADTYFSIPAATRYHGKRIKGYFSLDDDGNIEFRPMDASKPDLPLTVPAVVLRDTIAESVIRLTEPAGTTEYPYEDGSERVDQARNARKDARQRAQGNGWQVVDLID